MDKSKIETVFSNLNNKDISTPTLTEESISEYDVLNNDTKAEC